MESLRTKEEGNMTIIELTYENLRTNREDARKNTLQIANT